MTVQALLVIIAGFAFIFAPGVPMGLLGRRVPGLNRELMYWGLGVWLLALLPALFVQSVLRPLLPGAGGVAAPAGALLLAVLGVLVASVCVQGALYGLLRRRRVRPAQVVTDGLPLGFGAGLLPQIFNGIGLVSAGVALLLSGSAAGPLAGLETISLPQLLVVLLSLILFRLALLAVSAACGVLAARAAAGEPRLLVAAIALDTIFAAGALVIQGALGANGSAANVLRMSGALAAVLVVYYSLAFALAYGWLVRQLGPADDPMRGRRRAKERRLTKDKGPLQETKD